MPYRDGYSVLPKLHKLGDDPVFVRDEQYDYFLEEKTKAIQSQQVFLEHDISDEIYERVIDFIVSQADWVTANTFDTIAMQLQEDIAIHRVDYEWSDGDDWLSACHICFPSGWRPEEKIGRPLSEIHIPIPGMNLKAKLATTMVNHGPFYRFVWSPVYEPKRINYHPNTPKAKFDINNPQLYLKIETQFTVPFPDLSAGLFAMRQRITDDIDYKLLYDALVGMNDDEKAYKGISDDLITWLGDQDVRRTT